MLSAGGLVLLAVVLVGCQSQDPRGRPPKDDLPIDTDTVGSDTDDTALPPGSPVTETFTYAPPPVDVLFVVDSSSSMTGRIAELTGSMGPLVEAWLARGIDFHAGVVDIDDAPLQGRLIELSGHKWVDPTLPNPALSLQQLFDAVGDPSTQEAGLAASYKCLRATDPGEVNEGFLRDGSEIAIVVMTDEADQTNPGLVTPSEYIAFVLGLRDDPALVGFHAIAATPDYVDVAQGLGGVTWNVTNSPYGPALDAITQTVEGDNGFELAAGADEATLSARVIEPDGDVIELTWEALDYEASSRRVDLDDYYPPSGSTVEITYVPL